MGSKSSKNNYGKVDEAEDALTDSVDANAWKEQEGNIQITKRSNRKTRPRNTKELYEEYQRDNKNLQNKVEKIERDLSQLCESNQSDKETLLQKQEEMFRNFLKIQEDTNQNLNKVLRELSQCMSLLCTSVNTSNQVPTMPAAADASSSLPKEDIKASEDVGPTAFGKFQFNLSSQLTRDLITKLALVLDFAPAESDGIEKNQFHFIILLKSKGIISASDISPLIDALHEIKQPAVANAVSMLFNPQTN